MDRVYHRRVQTLHCLENLAEFFAVIRILLTVAGHIVKFRRYGQSAALDALDFQRFPFVRTEREKSVVHGIAGEKHAVRESLPPQKVRADWGTGHMQGRDVIRDNAVDLFGIG